MRAYIEIVENIDEIVTASVGGDEPECCDYGCPTDGDEMAGNW